MFLLSFPAPTAILVCRREDGQRAGDTYLMSILEALVLLLELRFVRLLARGVLFAGQIGQSHLDLGVGLLQGSVVFLELGEKFVDLLPS